MITEKVRTTDGGFVTRFTPENQRDRDWLRRHGVTNTGGIGAGQSSDEDDELVLGPDDGDTVYIGDE